MVSIHFGAGDYHWCSKLPTLGSSDSVFAHFVIRGAKPREPALSEGEGNPLSPAPQRLPPQALSLASGRISVEMESPASEACLCNFSHVSASAGVRKT